MDISNMKNIVVLKDLPSNLIDEAIVVLKENQKIKKYQYVEENKQINNKTIKEQKEKKNVGLDSKINKQDTQNYIIKEAEMVISNYISRLEMKSPKWKGDMKKLKKRYRKSVKLNFLLAFMTVMSIIFSFI